MATKRNWVPACSPPWARFPVLRLTEGSWQMPIIFCRFPDFPSASGTPFAVFSAVVSLKSRIIDSQLKTQLRYFLPMEDVINGRSDAILLGMWWSGQSGQFSPTEGNGLYLKINNRLKTNKILVLLQTYGRCIGRAVRERYKCCAYRQTSKISDVLIYGFQVLFECYFKANFLQASLLNIRTNSKQLFKCL